MEIDYSMCIETVSGKLVNPANPDPNNIELNDIAWSLSRIPRFAGHTITEVPYNVAQHSIYVSELLEKLFKDPGSLTGDIEIMQAAYRVTVSNDSVRTVCAKALLHDAHEAYFGDIPSPIKKIPELRPTFKAIEAKLDSAIFMKLGLTPTSEDEYAIIKFCDKLAQAIEGYQYMPSRGRNWVLPEPTLVRLQEFPAPLAPLRSYELFLERYSELTSYN